MTKNKQKKNEENEIIIWQDTGKHYKLGSFYPYRVFLWVYLIAYLKEESHHILV
jgi:hypothetical protein